MLFIEDTQCNGIVIFYYRIDEVGLPILFISSSETKEVCKYGKKNQFSRA